MDALVRVLAVMCIPAILGAFWFRRAAWAAEDAARDARAQRDRLVDRIEAMERREVGERNAGALLSEKHRVLQHRFASVLGEARAWRRRAVALGWTRKDGAA